MPEVLVPSAADLAVLLCSHWESRALHPASAFASRDSQRLPPDRFELRRMRRKESTSRLGSICGPNPAFCLLQCKACSHISPSLPYLCCAQNTSYGTYSTQGRNALQGSDEAVPYSRRYDSSEPNSPNGYLHERSKTLQLIASSVDPAEDSSHGMPCSALTHLAYPLAAFLCDSSCCRHLVLLCVIDLRA